MLLLCRFYLTLRKLQHVTIGAESQRCSGTLESGQCSALQLLVCALSQTAWHYCMNNRMFCTWWAGEDTATLRAANITRQTLNQILQPQGDRGKCIGR